MIISLHHRLDGGQFGDVFRSSHADRVIKVYRRVPNEQSDLYGRGLFRREEIAYENIMRFEDLRSHVPTYFGRPHIDDIVDDYGTSVAAKYHLECCLELAYISGECRKFCELPKNGEANALQLLGRFKGRVAYDFDCSFFHWTDPNRIVVIDFSPTA